jgi:hypothetical protein
LSGDDRQFRRWHIRKAAFHSAIRKLQASGVAFVTALSIGKSIPLSPSWRANVVRRIVADTLRMALRREGTSNRAARDCNGLPHLST